MRKQHHHPSYTVQHSAIGSKMMQEAVYQPKGNLNHKIRCPYISTVHTQFGNPFYRHHPHRLHVWHFPTPKHYLISEYIEWYINNKTLLVHNEYPINSVFIHVVKINTRSHSATGNFLCFPYRWSTFVTIGLHSFESICGHLRIKISIILAQNIIWGFYWEWRTCMHNGSASFLFLLSDISDDSSTHFFILSRSTTLPNSLVMCYRVMS